MSHFSSLLVLIFIAGCAAQQATVPSETLSGEVTLHLHDCAQGLGGVVKSDRFDAAQTEARADLAFANGSFDEAFGAYFAACDVDRPKSCYQAAFLLDQGLLVEVPADLFDPSLQKSLYQKACQAKFEDSCARAQSQR